MTKRYLVFAGDDHYPGGGWKDFRGDTDTMVEATDLVIGCRLDWHEIVDTDTMEVVLPIDYAKHGLDWDDK